MQKLNECILIENRIHILLGKKEPRQKKLIKDIRSFSTVVLIALKNYVTIVICKYNMVE